MPDPNPSERLAEIEARVKAATEEPWQWHAFDGDTDSTYHGSLYQADQLARYLADGRRSFPVRVLDGEVFANEADSEFIARAREDIPWLLEREKRLREALHTAAQEAAGGNLAAYERLVALADSGEAGGEAG